MYKVGVWGILLSISCAFTIISAVDWIGKWNSRSNR